MNKKNGSIKITILKIVFLPMVILTVLLTSAGSYFVAASIDEQVREGMMDVCNTVLLSLDQVYPGDYSYDEKSDGIYFYKGEHEFNGDFELIDNVKDRTGCDVTICFQQYAVITTLENKSGIRMIGSAGNDLVYIEVIEQGKSKFFDDAYFDDVNYYAYYSPLKDEDGNNIGMISVSMPAEYSKQLVMKAIIPLVFIALLAILVTSVFVLRFSNQFVLVIRKVQKYMKAIAKEDFRAELDPMVSNRTDELGQMAQSASSMAAALRKKVEEDLLTGLYNRRSADKKIKRTINNYVDKGVSFCLAIGDIDFFKKVNDTYGHEAGDDVLRAVSSTLKNFMLGKGYAIRWGGEEFILVYEGIDLERAASNMLSLLDIIRAIEVESGEFTIKVTMTFGIVECDPADKELIPEKDDELRDDALKHRMDTYIASADKKLYYGKEHGRNQLVVEMPTE